MTLNSYLSLYKRLKTREARKKIFNKAMLNLKHSDQQLFYELSINIDKERA